MQRLIKLLDMITKAVMVLAAFFAFGLAFIILVDIVTRNLGIMFYGVAEYIRNWLVVIIFLQIPYAVRTRSMLAVDIFVGQLSGRVHAFILGFGALMGALVFGAIAYGAFDPALDAFLSHEYEGEGVVEVAAWPARFAVVYGCGVSAIYYLLRLWEIRRGLDQSPPVVEKPSLGRI